MKATIPTYEQIKRSLKIYEQIDQLQNELANLFGVKSADQVPALLSGAGTPAKRRGRPPKAVSTGKRGRRKALEAPGAATVSDAAAPKKRGRKPGPVPGAKKAKRTISEAHRKAIQEAQKRRWAKVKGE